MPLDRRPDGSLEVRSTGRRRRPIAVATAEGLHVPGITKGPVPWDEISGVRLRAANNNLWLTFQPVPAARWGSRRTPWFRFWFAADRVFGFGDPGLPVATDKLDVPLEKVLEAFESVSGRAFTTV